MYTLPFGRHAAAGAYLAVLAAYPHRRSDPISSDALDRHRVFALIWSPSQ